MASARPTTLLALGLLLLLPCAAPEAAEEGQRVGPPDAPPCDRRLSREARAVVHEHLLPHVEELVLSLPPGCPLAPESDRYLPQERLKQELTRGHWRCGLCAKAFLSEDYLDLHLENRHADLLPQGPSTCLADYHAVLHAPRFEAFAQGEARWGADPAPCKRSAAERLRGDCHALAEACFPVARERGTRSVQLLREFFIHHICGAHTCDQRRKRTLLRAVTKLGQKRRRRRSGWALLYGVVLPLVVLFYIALWLLARGGPSLARSQLAQRRQPHALISSTFDKRHDS